MSKRSIPTPFANAERIQPDEADSSQQIIHTNGGTVRITNFDESDGRNEVFQLPSGASVRAQNYLDTTTQKIKFESITLDSAAGGWPRFTYTKDASGVQFARHDNGKAPQKIISQSDFLAAANSIVGPYDSSYTSALTLFFNEQKTAKKSIASDASHGQHVRLHITTDGHGAVIEERQAGAAPKTTHAFLNGDRLVIPTGLRDFNQTQKTEQWKGNEWSPELQAKLGSAMPKEDITALKNAMKSGKITLEVDEVRGTAVCQALAGKASPACKKSGAER